MPPTNLIINGDFANSGNSSIDDWSGNDHETRNSNTYISGTGAAQGRVVEMNGSGGQTTTLEQTFTVTDTNWAELRFEHALRSGATANTDGFRVEILDSGGNVIVTEDVFPTEAAFNETVIPVDFPAIGDYTIRFTELDDGADGRGALLDNVQVLICFAGDTRIRTPRGDILARDIKPGDQVETERGVQTVRWVGSRKISAAQMIANDQLCPVRIKAGALGLGLPTRDLRVSRQHRIMVRSNIAERMFGASEILVSAVKLVGLPGITLDRAPCEIDYVHILLDAHEIIFAENAPAETLLLGDQARRALSPAQLAEIDLLFPGLMHAHHAAAPVRPVPSGKKQRRFVERTSQNARPLLREPVQHDA